MRVKYENNVLTVVTNINKEVVEKGFSDLTAKNDKGDVVYGVSVAADGKAVMNAFSFTGNTYIEDKLAATIVMPMGTTEEDVQRKYGEFLIAADKYTKQIAEESDAKKEKIVGLFE